MSPRCILTMLKDEKKASGISFTNTLQYYLPFALLIF
jgi:hypothetical protein